MPFSPSSDATIAFVPGALDAAPVSISIRDYLDFLLIWIQKRTRVHQGDLVVYPLMVRHCLCCQESGPYADRTSGLCARCCDDQVCTVCNQAFEPSDETVGTYCSTCWGGLEEAWTTTFEESGAGVAETKVRAEVTRTRPMLGRCRHRGGG